MAIPGRSELVAFWSDPTLGLLDVCDVYGKLHPPGELVALAWVSRPETAYRAYFDPALCDAVWERAEVADVCAGI